MIDPWSAKAAIFMYPSTMTIEFLPTCVFNISLTHGMVKSLQHSLLLLDLSTEDDEDTNEDENQNENENENKDENKENVSELKTSEEQSELSLRTVQDDTVDVEEPPPHSLYNHTEFTIILKKYKSDNMSVEESKEFEECCKNKLTEMMKVPPGKKEGFYGPPPGFDGNRMIGVEIVIGEYWKTIVVYDCNSITEELYLLKADS